MELVPIFAPLVEKILPYLALAGALITAGGLALWRAWSKGKADQRAAQAAKEAAARALADQVDNDVGALTPAQARTELKTWEK